MREAVVDRRSHCLRIVLLRDHSDIGCGRNFSVGDGNLISLFLLPLARRRWMCLRLVFHCLHVVVAILVFVFVIVVLIVPFILIFFLRVLSQTISINRHSPSTAV